MAAAAARRLAALVGIAVVGTVTTGCGRDGDDPPEPSGPAATVTTPGVDPIGAPTSTDYPETAQEYAESAVTAWAAPDLIRLAELATDEVYEQIVEIPGPPDQAWRFIRCEEPTAAATPLPEGSPEGDAPSEASSACSFHNAEGDHLVLTVEHALLAEPQAVVAANFDSPSYPGQPRDYVEAFVAAWQGGNQARMELLAVADAAAAFQQLPAVAGYEVSYQVGDEDGDEDGQTVPVTLVLTGADGAETEADLLVGIAALGGEKAIIEATVPEP